MSKFVFFHHCLLVFCIKESIGSFTVLEENANKNYFLLINKKNLESPNMENGYFFRFTAKHNLAFLSNYRFHFFPIQPRRQLHFLMRFWTSEFVWLMLAWIGWHEKSKICYLSLSISQPEPNLLQKYRFEFFIEHLNRLSHFCMRGCGWNCLQYSPCFNI